MAYEIGCKRLNGDPEYARNTDKIEWPTNSRA
jgi:hypothetical protein